MDQLRQNHLSQWTKQTGVTTNLSGSANAPLSLNEVIQLSSNPSTTSKAFHFNQRPLGLGGDRGSETLRSNIADLYDHSLGGISKDNVLVAPATTGANFLVLRALLAPGDHIIVEYPTYVPLHEVVKGSGASISTWKRRFEDAWQPNVEELDSLVKQNTKMIILNNPNNPTGTQLSTATQKTIIEFAKRHSIIVFCDEIFRPLFHDEKLGTPTSFVEHNDLDYDNVLVTGSMSKVYGLSGVRIGWIVCRNQDLIARCSNVRRWTVESVGAIDEAIAEEVLSSRCVDAIIQKHLKLGGNNLLELQKFVSRFPKQLTWVKPTCGTVAFICFLDPKTGEALDEMNVCNQIKASEGVLLSPGSHAFGMSDENNDFRGFVRLHFGTPSAVLEIGLEAIGRFLNRS